MSAIEEPSGGVARRSRGRSAKISLTDIVGRAIAQFEDLTGRGAHGVSGVRREDEGWSVLVDVVELERIPDSTSVLATYRVDIDADGDVTGYERLRRYNRGATDPT